MIRPRLLAATAATALAALALSGCVAKTDAAASGSLTVTSTDTSCDVSAATATLESGLERSDNAGSSLMSMASPESLNRMFGGAPVARPRTTFSLPTRTISSLGSFLAAASAPEHAVPSAYGSFKKERRYQRQPLDVLLSGKHKLFQKPISD